MQCLGCGREKKGGTCKTCMKKHNGMLGEATSYAKKVTKMRKPKKIKMPPKEYL